MCFLLSYLPLPFSLVKVLILVFPSPFNSLPPLSSSSFLPFSFTFPSLLFILLLIAPFITLPLFSFRFPLSDRSFFFFLLSPVPPFLYPPLLAIILTVFLLFFTSSLIHTFNLVLSSIYPIFPLLLHPTIRSYLSLFSFCISHSSS